MTGDPDSKIDPELLTDPVDADSEAVPADDSAGSAPVAANEALAPAQGGGLAPYDPFRRYMAEIRQYPPLDRDEERELARLYRETGDRDALMRLITANLMLVVRIALSFRRAAKNLLDLVQEGNIGLLQAIDRFDPEMDARLPTYAAWWIRAYMVKFLLDNVRLVRVGTTNARRKLLRNLRKEKERLEQLGYDVGPKQLAEHFGVSETDVTDVQAALYGKDVSLDAPRRAEDDRAPSEMLTDDSDEAIDERVARQQLQQQAEQAIDQFRQGLGERDRLLLDQRILSEDPITLQAVGDRFGTSREAVRQAEARLMTKLSTHLREALGDLGNVKIGPR